MNRFARFYTITTVTLLFTLLLCGAASMQAPKAPYDKERLLKVVKLNALSTAEIVEAIEGRGVNFQLTPAVEGEFRQAGARPEIIDAMRSHYRGAQPTKPQPPPPATPNPNTAKDDLNAARSGAKVPPGAPLSKNEVVTLLQSGVGAERVEQFVEVRGVNFSLTPQISKEITTAGGNRSLLGAISERLVASAEPASNPNSSTNSPRTNPGTNRAPVRSGPDYEELTDQAISAMQASNANYAITLLQQAVAMEPARPTAYQLLGFAHLYGSQNMMSAETAMRAALDRRGTAVFRVYHDHDGFFKTFCQGSLFVTRTGVTFKADDGNHTFEAADAVIKEVDTNDFVGSEYGAFHIKVFQDTQNKKTKTFNFAPATQKKPEARLIIALIKDYQ